ncbi:P-selectin [Xyrichtys novacula]|uniref:E-selectin n=1 Tax=Xyrichtys novacula TaxID=13765 RepID=A0AAV1FIE7_XYRNO|nr:P-selectin [Xyrichtys novacula]
MFQESTKLSLREVMLTALLILLSQDLSSRGRAQAWSYGYSSSPIYKWLEARQWCQQHFTDMVFIRNQEENDYLRDLLPANKRHYWLGIQKVEGRWIWVQSNQTIPPEAQIWAQNEPDQERGQNCVEIYIQRKSESGKWNNEGCHRKKGAVCYTASCKQNSCSVHGDCVETIGNYTCKCHPGFQGPGCEEAIECKPLSDPEHGFRSCIDPYGPGRFNSSCRFQCDLGFQLVGVPQLQCQASGQWHHPVPLCQAKQCLALDDTNITTGRVNCSNPIAPHSYNSTCKFRCNEGFEIKGQDQIRCDHMGKWTASVPSCTVKKCPQILFPATGNMTCTDTLGPFTFSSRCNFTCRKGYSLAGDNTLTCLASGKWSKPVPSCKVKQCNSLKDPPHASMQCQHPLGVFSYSSICSIKCNKGFHLIGTNVTKCSSQGNWSHELPVCKARPCPLLAEALQHGMMNCSHLYSPYSFGSLCDFQCNEGFRLRGNQTLTCQTSGHWSQNPPSCQPVHCGAVHPLSSTLLMNCSHPLDNYSFGSQCYFTCKEGYSLNGTEELFCSASGFWNDSPPRCMAKRCPSLSSPSHGFSSCSGPHGKFNFGSQCTSTCDKGFILNGTAKTECTSLGRWSTDMPHCLARPCPLLAEAPQHGMMNCSHLYSPYSFGSICDFQCNEGFRLRGNQTLTCQTSGHWSQNPPSCQPVHCGAVHPLSSTLLMNCSHPLGNYSFGSQCYFTCKEGYSLNGTEELFCSASGFWNDSPPRCMVEGLPLGTALLMYTGIGAASAAVPLLLIGLAFLIVTQLKKKDSIVSDAPAWGDRENPAFEF